MASRLARGCQCFEARVGGDLAGYGWLSSGPEWIGEIQVRLSPGPGEGYIWNCVTLPEHRRRGVFSALLRGITGGGRAAGLTRMWIGSVAIPAEKAVRPVGFMPALHFASATLAVCHWLRVQPALGADPALVQAAQSVLSVRPGSSLRLSRTIRH
ncbi:MAG: GNAT family N-acetyltransferase [Candidatus Dormibacterales bacterium]